MITMMELEKRLRDDKLDSFYMKNRLNLLFLIHKKALHKSIYFSAVNSFAKLKEQNQTISEFEKLLELSNHVGTIRNWHLFVGK